MSYFYALIRTLLCLCALVFNGCNREEQNPESRLRIGTLYTADVLPLRVAEAEGYFTDAGVDVEIIPFQSAMERDSAFSARQLDGMTSDLVGTSLMRAKGGGLRIVLLTAGGQTGVGRMAILASPRSDIFITDDLKGRPVAMSSNSVVEYVADQLLSEHGFSQDDIRKSIVSKIPMRLNMLIEGQVPAAILPDPMAAYAEAKGARLILDDREDCIGHAVLAIRSEILETKSVAMQRMLDAVARATETINTDPAAYRQLLSDVTRTPAGVKGAEVVCYPVNQLPSEANLARVQGWLQRKGLLKERTSYNDIVTDEYIR
ncbi:Uncharacterized protein SCG7086_BT_00090 [Chlamydiales bacterium SCGC AG-110-P3]|nr:Uncharacterized protein SCG7086_BT_00090 [Chlamydiales bacterium SCGC AG-110-P3]